MNYPKPKKISDLPKEGSVPTYIAVPQYKNQKITRTEGQLDFLGNPLISDLTPEMRTALIVGIGIIAVGAVAYFLAKNKRLSTNAHGGILASGPVNDLKKDIL